jgi:CRISPR-associated protein Cas2
MTVIIANNLDDAIRGMLKRWFIEPKPNVFVSSIKSSTRKKVIEYISRNSSGHGFIVIYDDNENTQGFLIQTIGETVKDIVSISGLKFISEKIIENPF